MPHVSSPARTGSVCPRRSRIETQTTWVCGLPLSPLTASEAIEAIAGRIKAGTPSLIITASLNYARLTAQSPALRLVNTRAFLMLADGLSLPWASQWSRRPLPGRISGPELVSGLSAMAAERGHRVFLFGGGPGIAEASARNLRRHAPRLRVVGTEATPPRATSVAEHDALIARIQSARPDILLVGFGQPGGEIWLAGNLEELGVPVAVEVGTSLDVVAGIARRAPRGLFRIARRALANGLFLLRAVARDLVRARARHTAETPRAGAPATRRRPLARNRSRGYRGR
jgi:N-acetylglucosaminyldiphosphoundecaprenol N-acetyl-beta-D-mannosaminyltransferase